MNKLVTTLAAAGTAALMSSAVFAEEWTWWPFPMQDLSSGEVEMIDYSPRTEPVSQKWHICVLVPHVKDTYWVGINAGVVKEARRQGVKMTMLQAGGYTELNTQLAQFDDCVALGVDAIVIGAISEGALRVKIEDAAAKGIKMVGFVNPITESPVNGAIFADFDMASEVAGTALLEKWRAEGKTEAKVINFAGVAGSGWAEAAASGWDKAFEGSFVEILEHKFGETGKTDQLRLVEDAIQTYDDFDGFVGVAVMAEVAGDVLEQNGLADKVEIVPFYVTNAVLEGIKGGEITGAADVPKVVEGAIGVDMAIRALEGETIPSRLRQLPRWIDQGFATSGDMSPYSPPAGWDVVFNVE